MDGYDDVLDDAINEVLDETTVKFRIPVKKPDGSTQYETFESRDNTHDIWRVDPDKTQHEDPNMHPSFQKGAEKEAMVHRRRFEEEFGKPDERFTDYRERLYRQAGDAVRDRKYYDERQAQQPIKREGNVFNEVERPVQPQTSERREEPQPSPRKPKFNSDRFKRDEDIEDFQTYGQPREDGKYQRYYNYEPQRSQDENQPHKKNEKYEENTSNKENQTYEEIHPSSQLRSTATYDEQAEVSDLQESPPSKVKLPTIIPRGEWGALPAMTRIDPLTSPADTLVFTFDTRTASCDEEGECRRRVRELQARHMGEGLADIQYSFLVGGDGNLYEGRGWALQSGVPKQGKEGHNYNIAFIGRHTDSAGVPKNMIQVVQGLVSYARANGFVVEPPGKEEGYRRIE